MALSASLFNSTWNRFSILQSICIRRGPGYLSSLSNISPNLQPSTTILSVEKMVQMYLQRSSISIKFQMFMTFTCISSCPLYYLDIEWSWP